MAWPVDFYEDEDGRAPVEEFLDDLPEAQRAKALALVRLLEERGPALTFPYTSQVHGRLRELRVRLGKTRLRLFYFGDSRRVFILLHGIIKSTEKLPALDIRVAEQRMAAHEDRIGKKR